LTLGVAELAENRVEDTVRDELAPLVLSRLESSMDHLLESLEDIGLKLYTLRTGRDGIHYMACPSP
jgi:hypothetical protein